MAIIARLSREGGLSGAGRAQKRMDEQMSRTQIPQMDVSFSHDQINILHTLLR